MKRLMLVLAAVACLGSIVAATSKMAYGYVFGSTNFSFSGYPDPSCSQPYVPYEEDEYAWESFKYEFEDYQSCIQEYLEAAHNDQERIAEKADEVVEDFNSFVDSIR